MSERKNIAMPVIRRLPRYYRFIGELVNQGTVRISSNELAKLMHVTASQIRQDLNCFGGFGQQGYGYNLIELRTEIGKILGVDQNNKALLIGAGSLGTAIATGMNFSKYGCALKGIFDNAPDKQGKIIAGIKVADLSGLEAFCASEKPSIAILCIPKSGAADIVDRLVKAGVKAFWNFSHYDMRAVSGGVIVENVHLGDSMLTLSYRLLHTNDPAD